jgi:hypothetical protein
MEPSLKIAFHAPPDDTSPAATHVLGLFSVIATFVVATALIGLPAHAGGKTRVPPPEFVPPTANFHLRAAFDTDPVAYLGRFVPDDALVPDEAAARKTACSQHITVRRVGGGGVEYDEIFEASSAAAIGLGLPRTDLILGGTSGQAASLRAKYTLTTKMVADISDPVAFASCCRQNPSECTGRFVSEFIEGTGTIWAARSSSADASVLKALQAGGLDVQAHGGVAWGRARNFPNPVYFAFRVTEVPKVDCKALIDSPPQSDKGLYFGSISEPMPSEKLAREAAMAGAREQAVKYLGEAIAMGSVSSTVISGPANQAVARFEDEQFVRRAAEGIARYVKDEISCVEESPSVSGPRFTVRTLALLPKGALDDAARAALEP